MNLPTLLQMIRIVCFGGLIILQIPVAIGIQECGVTLTMSQLTAIVTITFIYSFWGNTAYLCNQEGKSDEDNH